MVHGSISYIYIDGKNRVIEAQLSCAFSRRGKLHFAECPELQLIDQGYSKREALENLTEMAAATIIEAVRAGKLDGMLRVLGFTKQRIPLRDRTIFKQVLEGADNLTPLPIEVPLEPVVTGHHVQVFG